MNTVLAELVGKDIDNCGYITYIFRCLDEDVVKSVSRYIMCVRYPNWEHRDIALNEQGFLTINEVTAGKDAWFDKEKEILIPYKFNAIQFIKFIEKPIFNHTFIM